MTLLVCWHRSMSSTVYRSCAAAGGGRLPTGVPEDRLEEIEGAEAGVVRRHRAVGLDEDQQRYPAAPLVAVEIS